MFFTKQYTCNGDGRSQNFDSYSGDQQLFRFYGTCNLKIPDPKNNSRCVISLKTLPAEFSYEVMRNFL